MKTTKLRKEKERVKIKKKATKENKRKNIKEKRKE
jgi:hypothetical protein